MKVILIGVALSVLALLGTPLFVIISAIALLSFYFAGIDSSAVIIELYRLSSTSVLLAIPFFTFAGYLLAESNTPNRLVKLSQSFVGWLPGGLAIVALLSCAIFTAFTGASGVTIVAIGGLLLPVLIKEKYSEKFSLGLLTSSGSLGLLFPPSLPIILYGVVSKTSIDKLFIAGILPGVFLIILLSLYNINRGIAFSVPKVKFSFKNILESIKGMIWEIPLPFIVLGGIYSGILTVTEIAVVTVIYVFIVEVFIYRDISLSKDVPRIIRESMLLVGGILIILGTAMGLTNYLVDEQIPIKIFEFIEKYISSKILFLILLNIFLLIVGCMMDIFSATIVVVPIITPVAIKFGVDPVHLGIIFLTNLEIGYSTPPVGLNLFISSLRFNRPIVKLYLATIPFICILLIALLVITYFPQMSLWLVEFLKIK